MLTITVGNLSVSLHDDIRQMPFKQRADFLFHLLLHREAGSDNDSQNTIRRCLGYLEAGELEDLRTSLENLYLSIETVKTHTVHEANAFYCLIHSVDQRVINAFSESERSEVLDLLNAQGLTTDQIRETVEHVKKNSMLNWQHISRHSIA